MRAQRILQTLIIALFFPAFAVAQVSAAPLKTNGRIAFVTDRDGNYEIYTMNPDGSLQTRLTNNTATDADPAWSPDGTKVAFATSRDGHFQIYLMNADGSNQQRITNDLSNDVFPAWSPDGSKIAFASDRTGSGQEIFIMNADGSNQIRLTFDDVTDETPEWSPDGTRISFNGNKSDNTGIYLINPDGTNEVNLTSSLDSQAKWSPDGTKIAFTSGRDGVFQIYTMNPDGSAQTRITNDAWSDQDPAWSPDGTKIAFTTSRDGNSDIYVMNPDGSAQTRVTVNGASNNTDPSWQAAAAGTGVPCPFLPAFWRLHPEAWKITSLKLGKETYTKAQLLVVLESSVAGDESLNLARQLIGVKLNIADHSPSAPIQAKVIAAQQLLAKFAGHLPYHVKQGTADGQSMALLAHELLAYNSRTLTPFCAVVIP